MLLAEQRDRKRFAPAKDGIGRRRIASVIDKENLEFRISFLQA
jgi:hypothetical protein